MANINTPREHLHTYSDKEFNGTTVLYANIQKIIFGFIRGLLFYPKLVTDIKIYGFKLNPYDPCVADEKVK